MAGLSSLGEDTNLDKVSKWRRDNRDNNATGRMVATNLLTTTSKYMVWYLPFEVFWIDMRISIGGLL